MGSCSSRSSTDIVDISTHQSSSFPSPANLLSTSEEEEASSDGLIPPEGFYPKYFRTSSPLSCQELYTSLAPNSSEIHSRQTIESLLRSFKENGVLRKVHSYVDAISLSRPTFEVLSSLLVEPSAPYLQGVQKKNHDLIKSYAIYYWVSNNIEYNLTEWNQMISSSSHPTVTPKHVFKRRSSVCSGYANLYRSLCIAAGLEVEVINGYFKRPLSDSSHGELFRPQSRNSHAWNAVYIHKVWCLVDCTYGAGIISETGFTKLYNDHYFAVSPQQLIFTHWPDLSQWQLLEEPVNLHEFKKFIVMTPDVCRLGLSFDACEVIHINADQIPVASVQVTLPSNNYQLVPTLTSLCQDSSQIKYDRHVFVVSKNNNDNSGIVKEIFAVLPNVGNFVLRIFLKNNLSFESKMIFCTSYVICCESELVEYCGFPKIIPDIANRLNFELLHWTDHREQASDVKSYISECTTGKLTLYFKTTLNSTDELLHMITPGCFNSDDQSSRQYHFYTSLTTTQDKKSEDLVDNYYKLNVVFPLDGLWTVCVMQRDSLNDAFNEPLLLYQVNVRGAIRHCTYPWIKSNDVNILNEGPLVVSGKEVFVLPFSMRKVTKLLVELVPVRSDGRHSEESNYDQFVYINKLKGEDSERSYQLMVVFPESGKWLVNVFHQPMGSIKQFSGLFSLYFDVVSRLSDTIFPIILSNSCSNASCGIVDSLPLCYDSENGLFCVRLSTLKSTYFNVNVFPTNEDLQSTRQSLQLDYWCNITPLTNSDDNKGVIYCIQVVFHEAGEWSVRVEGTGEDSSCHETIQLFEFRFIIKSGPASTSRWFQTLYPKLYPAFYDLQISLPTVPYQYCIEDKLQYTFTMNVENEFNVIIYKDDTSSDRLHSQALVYPDKFEANKYILEVVFPQEGDWIIQMFTGQQRFRCEEKEEVNNCRPVLSLCVNVKTPITNHTYPWIHPSFFTKYQMDFKSPSYLLPTIISQHSSSSKLSILTLIRPQGVNIIHKAKNENGDLIEGITCLIQSSDNEYRLSADFPKTGQWTILLYATTILKDCSAYCESDEWELVLVHDVSVCSGVLDKI